MSEIEGLRMMLKNAKSDNKQQIQDALYTAIGKANQRNSDNIIKHTFNKASEIGKFRTITALWRKTIDPYFSAELNREAMFDMTFQEWAGYAVNDDNWYFWAEDHPKEFGQFIEEAKKKGIYAETYEEWMNLNR